MTDTPAPPAEASRGEKIRQAYAAGEGGYAKLAKRFDVSVGVVRGYILKKSGPSYAKSCERKIRYDTADAASQAMAVVESKPDRAPCRGDKPLLVYQCTICGGFHFGHPKRKAADYRRKLKALAAAGWTLTPPGKP